MRIFERFKRLWVLVGVMVIALIYVSFTLMDATNLDTWRFGRFRFPYKAEDLSKRLNSTTKKILFWNTMFGDKTFYFGKDDFFRDCPNGANNCWATHERSLVNVEDFDAVLFHGNELKLGDLPTARRDYQVYVFVNLESPEYRTISYSRFEDRFFNATMTYRLDSDVVWTYGNVQRLEDNRVVAPRLQTVWTERLDESTDSEGTSTKKKTWDESELIKARRKKTKSVVWFVSNCKSKSGRESYVNELATHVDVDIFGLCGNEVRCPATRDCFREVVEPDYYFYLSFENSMCQDYVTEKLWNALKHNVVPIVYGGANYTLFAPPGSYINALDFDSPKELANYLKRLIAEPSEYDKYFEWKKTYRVLPSNNRVICQLCQYLHDNNRTKSYSPLSAWYKADKCPLQGKLKNSRYLTRKTLKKLR